MDDVFSTVGAWKEARYDVADTSSVFGMATTLTADCNNGAAAQLELRLAHRFSKLRVKMGQANDSPSSDRAVVVDIVVNGKQLDTQKIAFDVVQNFDEDITDGNALKMNFHLDKISPCASFSDQATVNMVVEDLTVS